MTPTRRRWLGCWLACATLVLGCADEREDRARQDVRRLILAPDDQVEPEYRRVLSLGAYALVDIEQKLPEVPIAGRLRLVEVMRRMGSREALPLLDFLGRTDLDAAVRARASEAVAALRQRR